jgi:hypothetical protein
MTFPEIVHLGLRSDLFMAQAFPAEPLVTIRPSRCQVSRLVHSLDATAQEPPTPGFGGESERLTTLEQKLKERGELLKAAVNALQAGIARRKALEAELEDWRMKARMTPELLKAMMSLEALMDPGTLSETLKSSFSTDTPNSRGIKI